MSRGSGMRGSGSTGSAIGSATSTSSGTAGSAIWCTNEVFAPFSSSPPHEVGKEVGEAADRRVYPALHLGMVGEGDVIERVAHAEQLLNSNSFPRPSSRIVASVRQL
jgi:hypothetical protein